MVKANDDIIWAGTRTLFQYIKPYNIDMPFLFKTDFMGNPIWYREYIVFPNDDEDRGMEVNSFVQTPDGGFVLVGDNANEARDNYRQSIIMKVDSFGCLIHGCHLDDSKIDSDTVVYQLAIYPNPANASFVVEVPNFTDQWTYEIFNNTGQLLQNGILTQSQNQIFTQTLPNGIYQIILQNPKTNHHENHSFIIVR